MLSSATAAVPGPDAPAAPGLVLVSESDDLIRKFEVAMDGQILAVPGPLPVHPDDLLERLGLLLPPDVLVLDLLEDEVNDALQLAARFDDQFPRTSVLLVSELGDALALPALRAGVRDVLDPLSDVPEIRRVLDRAFETAARTPLPVPTSTISLTPALPTGRVISVVSPKGGVGKTTVSTNLAVGIARTAPHSTVLVDLDVQFGDVASGLNLEPEFCLTDGIKAARARDSMALKTYLTLHPSGLYVLAGPDNPADADGITGDDLSVMLQLLAAEFRYVILDTAPGLSDHTLAAMDNSTDLVLLTSMDVPGVRGMRKEIDALDVLGMVPNGRHVVINFVDRKNGLSMRDVTATLDRPVDVMLPRSQAVITSVNQGVPLLQNGGKDPMTRQLERLLERFVPVQESGKRRRGRHYRESKRRI